jgi:hypothetical protein
MFYNATFLAMQHLKGLLGLARSPFFFFPSLQFLSQFKAWPFGAELRPEGRRETTIIRTTTRLINVNVVVTDRQDRLVRSHLKDDFQIFDNGRTEQIAFLIFACLDVYFSGRSRRQ